VRAALAGAAVTLLALAGPAPTALAAPPRPADLHVIGGDRWRSQPSFDLAWSPPAAGGATLTGVHYRIRDPLGAGVAAHELGWVGEGVADVSVPAVPGAYTAEVWFEDSTGAEGPAATATLRFDDARPGRIPTPAVLTWIGRGAFPLQVNLGPPLGTRPLAGIRGYAVAIDSSPDGSPCAAADRCSEAEITLSDGAGGEALTIAALPEGVSHLHAVAVSGSGMKSASAAHATLRVDTVDPVTRLEGAPVGWADRPVRLTAIATDGGSGMEPDGEGPPPLTAIRVGDGTPAVAPGGSVTTTVIAEGAHTVAYYARDAAGNVDDGREGNGLANRAPTTVAVRIDRTPPTVAFASLQDPSEPEAIGAFVADSLSGPSPSRGWVGVRPLGSNEPFEPLPTRVIAGELRALWDSDSHPGGEFEFRAVGYDAAGNAAGTGRRANGSAMILANPLKVATVLGAGFGGRTLTWHRCTRRGTARRCRRETVADFGLRPASRTVPYGRGVRIGGQLTTRAGTDLAGMPVRIVESFAPGSEPASRTSIARTDDRGFFSLRLAAGPSREIAASFGGSPSLSRANAPPLGLLVRSRVRLRPSTTAARVGGAPVVFHGRVEAAPRGVPPSGVSVQLQFRLPGLPWSEFRTVQTNAQGRFRYAYGFSDDDSRGVRFQFRAHVPAQGDWPYEPGSSRPVAVRGR